MANVSIIPATKRSVQNGGQLKMQNNIRVAAYVNTVCCVDISALKFVRRSCSTVAYKAHLLPYVATYPLFRA